MARHVVAHSLEIQFSLRRDVVHTDQWMCFSFDSVLLFSYGLFAEESSVTYSDKYNTSREE